MSCIEIAIRLFLLAISCYGYIMHLKKYMFIDFSLGWLCAAIGSVMFLAGLLNMLESAAWLIFVCGLVLFATHVVRNKGSFSLSPGIVFFSIAAGYFLFLLHGSKIENIDNFTHWAVAAKTLIITDTFPNSETLNYIFTSYPLGSASFIYYVTQIVGIQSEWLQMWAQAVFMSAVISGLFGFAKSRQGILVAAASALILLCSSINFVDLLVDTLLPITAVGAISFCIYYREELESKQIFLLPYTIFLLSIKNSGIFFVVFILLYVFLSMEKKRRTIRIWVIVLIASLSVLFLWKLHVGQTFGDDISMHNMSFENYMEVFSGKTMEDKRIVLTQFGKQDSSEVKLLGILFFLGCSIYGFMLLNQNENLKEIRKLLVYMALSYTIYRLGMLGMYLFSMHQYEAKYLAGYDRYYSTILIFCTGILTIAFMLGMQEVCNCTVRHMKDFLVIGVFLVALCLVMQPHFHYYLKQGIFGSKELREREKTEMLMEDYQIEKYRSYAVIISEDRIDKTKDGYQQLIEVGYLRYMLQYQLDSDHVKITYGSDLEISDIEGYDYVILYDETDHGRALLNAMFGEQEKSVICTIGM